MVKRYNTFAFCASFSISAGGAEGPCDRFKAVQNVILLTRQLLEMMDDILALGNIRLDPRRCLVGPSGNASTDEVKALGGGAVSLVVAFRTSASLVFILPLEAGLTGSILEAVDTHVQKFSDGLFIAPTVL